VKRRTKIVCTLGPATNSQARIRELIGAGMNVARLNCSHGDWQSKKEWIEWIRAESPRFGPIGILADLQGPKFRIGDLREKVMELQTGQSLTVGRDLANDIPILGEEILEAMSPNCRLLLGDGEVELKIAGGNPDRYDAKVVTGGKIGSRKGVTLVGKSFEVPALTDKDKEDAYHAMQAGVDFIALSYVRRAADLRELRRLIDQYDPTVRLCAKIETREALKDLDEILKATDIVMVARGDLGLQMELEDVPLAQKTIIQKSAQAGKPVITATQMLESMLTAPRPTRAEASDIANAILDGTDAVMLSGETAAGNYPIEAVKTMARIAEKAETHFDHEDRFDTLALSSSAPDFSTQAVAKAAVQLATTLKARAIVTTSTSGLTPRMVSKFRPRCPVLTASWNPRTQAQLSVVWGVEAVYMEMPSTTDEIVARAIDQFMSAKRLKIGDTVVITAGVPAGKTGNTNLIEVETLK